MQEAAHIDARPAFDRFDALSKASEAALAREAGVALLEPPPGRVLRAHGEAMVPDLAPGNGVSPAQRAREFAMLDTLECPDMVAIGASQLRLEALTTLGLLQPAMDAATTVQAANSIEKMLSHQLAALHHHGMRLLARAVGADELGAPDPVMALRYSNAAVRMFQCCQEGAVALLKLKAGGKQTVVVQHVRVSDGGQAVIAGQMTKHGGRAPGAPSRNEGSTP